MLIFNTDHKDHDDDDDDDDLTFIPVNRLPCSARPNVREDRDAFRGNGREDIETKTPLVQGRQRYLNAELTLQNKLEMTVERCTPKVR